MGVRGLVVDLTEAPERYRQGDAHSLSLVRDALAEFADRYPQHLMKEESAFFRVAMKYIAAGDREAFLDEMCNHDRAMIHESSVRWPRSSRRPRRTGSCSSRLRYEGNEAPDATGQLLCDALPPSAVDLATAGGAVCSRAFKLASLRIDIRKGVSPWTCRCTMI